MSAVALFAISSGAVSSGAACSGPDTLECIEVEATCAPLYAPTWENVFANTIEPKCGTGGGACHEGASARSGLRLDESQGAYEALTNQAKPYVMTDDVACSELLQRVYSEFSSLRMPRGSSLPDAERCALQQWVLAGAPGPVTVSP